MIILNILMPLLFIGGIVTLIVRAIGGRSERETDTGTSVRRFFQYGLLLGVGILVAIGLSDLAASIFPDTGRRIAGDDTTTVARSLAFIVVGGPALWGLIAWTRRELPADRDSFAWPAFLTLGSIISLIVSATAAFETLEPAFGDTDFAPETLTRALVWGAAWWILWRVSSASAVADDLRLERLAGSALGLAGAGTSLWYLIATGLRGIYDAAFEVTITNTVGEDLWRGAVGLAITGAIWWWYWLRTASKDETGLLWHVYVILAGVLGGLITAISAVGTAVFTVLQWFFGDPTSSVAARHFDNMPGVLAAAVVGWLLWWYHRDVLHRAQAVRTEVSRAFEYIVAGVGLLAAAGGLTTTLVAVFQSIVPSDTIVGSEGTINVLLAAITLLVIGAPLWWRFWSRAETAAGDDPTELASPSRRVYLFGLFGVGGVVALINLIVLIFLTVEDIIDGTLSGETLHGIRVPLALVITTGVVAWYHWRIYRHDAEHRPEPEVQLRQVLLVGATPDLRNVLGQELHVPIRAWRLLDHPDMSFDPAPTIQALRDLGAEQALVVVDESGVTVRPVAPV